LAAGLLCLPRMSPLIVACNGPGGQFDQGLAIVLLMAAVVAIGGLASLVAGYVLSIRGYQRRSLKLAIGGAALGGIHLLVAIAVPVYLFVVVPCLAIAAAAAGRTLVHTA
jgi:hypothetical protein